MASRTAPSQLDSDVAIRVVGLGKTYRIPHLEHATTLRDSLQQFVTEPRRRLGALLHPEHDEIIWALKDVSFELPQGQVLGIIGRNGAGKSTLLKILSRITEPTEGYADINGRLASLLEVGTGFHPELTGRDNVFLNGAVLGMRRSEIAAKFDQIVEFAGVEKFIDTPVKRYSSGMYLRLAFAVAAHLEPEILVVDEVLAVGDTEFQQKSLGKMREVTGEGRTILFVSHNIAAVRSLCDRAILLKEGRVIVDGEVDDAVTRYLGETVRADATGHIPAFAPRIGSGEARLTSVQVLNRCGQPTAHIHLGEPFTILLTADVATRVRDALFEVGISSLDGIRVATSFSTDGAVPPWMLEVGPTSVALDLEPVLLPGRYTIDIGVHHLWMGRTIDYMERILEFEVLAVADTSADALPTGHVRGFVRPRGHWHSPASAEAGAAKTMP